ncbi:unnamed protein product [Absidia cylindrospora]
MSDLRIKGYNALLTPNFVSEEFPMSDKARETVSKGRDEISNILHQQDDRLLVVVGPCSIHDAIAAKEYAALLLDAKERLKDHLLIVMRSYFEKPRTIVGWKGMINDPDIDGSYDINKGIRIARGLLLSLTEMGMPVALELLDTISPQYLADLISWGAIGARTTESQLHREIASGSSFPIGFRMVRMEILVLHWMVSGRRRFLITSSALLRQVWWLLHIPMATMTVTLFYVVGRKVRIMHRRIFNKPNSNSKVPNCLHVSWSIARMETPTRITATNPKSPNSSLIKLLKGKKGSWVSC